MSLGGQRFLSVCAPYVLSCLSVAHAADYFAYQWWMYSDAFIGICSGLNLAAACSCCIWHAGCYHSSIYCFTNCSSFLFAEQRPSSISEQSHEKRYLIASLLVHSCLVLMQSSCCRCAFILPPNWLSLSLTGLAHWDVLLLINITTRFIRYLIPQCH